MKKLTICLQCKTKFKHDASQKRKFCSNRCNTITNNKLRKKQKASKEISYNKIGYRWELYFHGLVNIENIKNLMPERYKNLRSEIINQNNGNR